MQTTDLYTSWLPDERLTAARKRIAEMDEVDGGSAGLPLDMQLRTAMTALAASIRMRDQGKIDDQGCAEDAFCYLQDAELAIRKLIHEKK